MSPAVVVVGMVSKLFSLPPCQLFPVRREGAVEDASARAHKDWLQGEKVRRRASKDVIKNPAPCGQAARWHTRHPP